MFANSGEITPPCGVPDSGRTCALVKKFSKTAAIQCSKEIRDVCVNHVATFEFQTPYQNLWVIKDGSGSRPIW